MTAKRFSEIIYPVIGVWLGFCLPASLLVSVWSRDWRWGASAIIVTFTLALYGLGAYHASKN